MIARAGSGWQTVLADLSLILFMVTASAVSQAPPQPARAEEPELSARSEPQALWRAGPDAPPIGQWLADQGADPRQQLTIVARYAPGHQGPVMAEASALVGEASRAGLHARLTLEPGEPEVVASLAYDTPPALLARNLLQPTQQQGARP